MRSLMIALALSLTTSVTALAQPAERSPSAVRFEAEQILYNRAATLVRRTPEARGEAAIALIRQAGFEPAVESFMGGDVQGLPTTEGRNITFVVPGHGNCGCEIWLTAHYDAVRLQNGDLADGWSITAVRSSPSSRRRASCAMPISITMSASSSSTRKNWAFWARAPGWQPMARAMPWPWLTPTSRPSATP